MTPSHLQKVIMLMDGDGLKCGYFKKWRVNMNEHTWNNESLKRYGCRTEFATASSRCTIAGANGQVWRFLRVILRHEGNRQWHLIQYGFDAFYVDCICLTSEPEEFSSELRSVEGKDDRGVCLRIRFPKIQWFIIIILIELKLYFFPVLPFR